MRKTGVGEIFASVVYVEPRLRSSKSNYKFVALLGEADILAGHVLCPHSPPDSLASFVGAHVPKELWIVEGICAYVPQVRLVQSDAKLDGPLLYFRLPGFATRQSKVSIHEQPWLISLKPPSLQKIFCSVHLLTKSVIGRR
jgi:hypothetical protein